MAASSTLEVDMSELTIETVLREIVKASKSSKAKPSHTLTKQDIPGACLRSIRPCWKGTWTEESKKTLVDIMSVCMDRKFLSETLYKKEYVSEQGRYCVTQLGVSALKKGLFDPLDNKESLIPTDPEPTDLELAGDMKLLTAHRFNAWAAHLQFYANLIPTMSLIRLKHQKLIAGDDQFAVFFVPTIDGFCNSFQHTAARPSSPTFGCKYVKSDLNTAPMIGKNLADQIKNCWICTRTRSCGHAFGGIVSLHICLCLEDSNYDVQLVNIDGPTICPS